jgi:hypothetical protein
MQLGIKIDFENTYDIENLSSDLTSFQFKTVTKKTKDAEETEIELGVILANNRNKFLPQVFNLGFGPFKEDKTIDDKAEIIHKDSSKVYSTILLGALTFLNSNKDRFVGVDGSDIRRAYLYFRLLQSNYDYLTQYFKLIGVKYYIRLLRGIEQADPYTPDPTDLATQPFIITKGESIRCEKLYNYFIYNLI